MTGDASEPVWSVGRGRTLDLAPGRLPHLMAVVNCTPDSFSDGGAHADPAAAAAHAERCAEAGATLLDVGGESTRPGAAPVDGLEQIRRTRSVVAALAGRTKALISIDTTRAEVAAAALAAGADVVNDQSAGRDDPDVLAVVAASGSGMILMHRPEPPAADSYSDRYQQAPRYRDVVEDVKAFLASRVDAAVKEGIPPSRLAVDPGFGFGKDVVQNFQLLAGLHRLRSLGLPIVVGLSRKSFLGAVAGIRDPALRVHPSVAAAIVAVMQGAAVVRVHDVAAHAEAMSVLRALQAATAAPPSEPPAGMTRATIPAPDEAAG